MKKLTCKKAGLLLLFVIVTNIASAQHSTRHEVRLSLGITDLPKSYQYSPGYDSFYPNEFYLGNKISTQGLNISYTYQMLKWLSFGTTVNYLGRFQNKYNLYSDELHSEWSNQRISFTPIVRFDWLRTRYVNFYSSLGIGMGFSFIREKNLKSGEKTNDGEFIVSGDFIPLGISVGRRVFGFFELGPSTLGAIKIGIGYRFND